MEQEEKSRLKDDLDSAIHKHQETTPGGTWVERTIVEPDSLKEVLQRIIEALPSDEL